MTKDNGNRHSQVRWKINNCAVDPPQRCGYFFFFAAFLAGFFFATFFFAAISESPLSFSGAKSPELFQPLVDLGIRDAICREQIDEENFGVVVCVPTSRFGLRPPTLVVRPSREQPGHAIHFTALTSSCHIRSLLRDPSQHSLLRNGHHAVRF